MHPPGQGAGQVPGRRVNGDSDQRHRQKHQQRHQRHRHPARDRPGAVSGGGQMLGIEAGGPEPALVAPHPPLEIPYPGSLWYGLATDDAGTLLLLGMRGHAFRSDDGGETWRAAETGTDQSLQAGLRLRDGRIVAVGLGGVVLTSQDGGRSFRPAVQADRRGIAALAEAADGSWLLFGESGATRRAASAAD